MDESEKLAKQHLLHLGFDSVVYEPDGNVPPDFLVDGKIAVEVRRLNQNEVTESGPRGLEEVAIPFLMAVKRLLACLGPPRAGTSWFVHYALKRPLPERSQLLSRLRQHLEAFRDDDSTHEPCWMVLDDSLEVRITRAGDTYATSFLLGSSRDEDTGGWVLSETLKNLRICIDEKTRKVAAFRHNYSQWWLVLIDYIGYGVSECDRDLFREHLKMEHSWDKIILLNPLDPRTAFEIP